jgi:hypothetical protein
MKHTIELNDRQLSIIRDLLDERLEDIDEDIAHYEENPSELAAETESGEEPLAIADYEHYRDEVQSLLSVLPEANDAD